MIFIIIMVLVIGLVFYLGSNYNQQKVGAETRELLQTKYSELIAHIQGNSPNPQIFNSTSETFSCGWITPNADNRIHFSQKSGYVQIKWLFKARIVWLNKSINLSKEWDFRDYENAEEVANKIKVEMSEAFDGAGL